jgi:transcriptional regulator GlxA family with amidase domain
MRRVVIAGPPPVQVLDVTGPLEVFASVAGYEIELGTPGESDVLRTSRNIGLSNAKPLRTIEGAIDTLVIAGGPGAENGLYSPEFLAWVAEAARRSRRVACICTGAFVLAAAGLLDGRKAVTHWRFCDRLAREFPLVNVRPDPIFLKDGNIYTSAGITAGIDLSLALVEEDYGHEEALRVARLLVMFLVRPGGQAQYSSMLSRQKVTSQPLRELQVWMLEHLRENLTVDRLAERMRMSPRHLTRVCVREMKMNPGQLVERMRVETAQQFIANSALGLKQIADECGFGSADRMRRSFVRVLGVTASAYVERFKRDSSNLQGS